MLARLSILSGKRQGETLDLQPGSYQLGTGRGADIELRDKGIGFKHAQLTVEDDRMYLEDLKSKGGTLVEGAPIDGRVELAETVSLQLGTVELRLEAVGTAVALKTEASEPESSEPEAIEPEAIEPEAIEPEAIEPAPSEPEPVVAVAADSAAAGVEPLGELSDDADVLKGMLRDLHRRLAEKSQEAAALSEALEASAGGGGALDDGLGGYSEAVGDDLEARMLELQHAADEQTALILEKDEEITVLQRELSVLRDRQTGALDDVRREQEAMARDVLRGHEKAEAWRTEVDEAKAEVARFEQVNAELLLETEELKEKLEAQSYQLEQEQAQRGALVRERLVELRREVERLEQSNAEMRTLVEAYEEKIDELDERVEELEGENEAQQDLVKDVRDELAKVKTERDTMVKTLRKKVQALELKLERLKGESARALAAAESQSTGQPAT